MERGDNAATHRHKHTQRDAAAPTCAKAQHTARMAPLCTMVRPASQPGKAFGAHQPAKARTRIGTLLSIIARCTHAAGLHAGISSCGGRLDRCRNATVGRHPGAAVAAASIMAVVMMVMGVVVVLVRTAGVGACLAPVPTCRVRPVGLLQQEMLCQECMQARWVERLSRAVHKAVAPAAAATGCCLLSGLRRRRLQRAHPTCRLLRSLVREAAGGEQRSQRHSAVHGRQQCRARVESPQQRLQLLHSCWRDQVCLIEHNGICPLHLLYQRRRKRALLLLFLVLALTLQGAACGMGHFGLLSPDI